MSYIRQEGGRDRGRIAFIFVCYYGAYESNIAQYVGRSGGKDALLSFFRQHEDVDIFTLQEVWHGGEEFIGARAGGGTLSDITTTLLHDISVVLETHNVYFEPLITDCYGLAIFLSDSLRVVDRGSMFVY